MNKYNIVWFCTDQQRYDTISGLGGKGINTPNIDRLINEGVAFERAYTQAPVCTPSRASFLTGRYPKSTRATFNGNDNFSKDETLVTKIFADNGYKCGLVGKLHLTSAKDRLEKRADDGYSFFKWSHHPQDDWDAGIDDYQTWIAEKGLKWSNIYGGCHWEGENQNNNEGYLKPVYEKGHKAYKGVPKEYHQTTWCIDETINFIEANKEEPWLISINPFDPHHPIDPPQEYKDAIDLDDIPLPLWKEGELNNKPPFHKEDYLYGAMDRHAHSIVGMTDKQKKETKRDYHAQIELVDEQFGRLIDYLDRNQLRENTIIIFMSDHGELDGDHGVYYKGPYFYESLVHVPLIMSCPSLIQENCNKKALVELVDIAPTLLELTGIEIPHYMQGKSMANILIEENSKDYHKNAIYTEYYDCLPSLCYKGMHATMYYDGRYKIVLHHGKDYGELYDLVVDPEEFENLWYESKHYDLKNQLTKRAFDHAILCNEDKILGVRGNY